MGIKDLSSFLRQNTPEAFKKVPDIVEYMTNKRVAFDMTNMVIRIASARRTSDVDEVVHYFVDLHNRLRNANVTPYYVFDGPTQKGKWKEKKRRKREHKRSEERLRDKEERLQSLLNNTKTALTEQESNLRITAADAASILAGKPVRASVYRNHEEIESLRRDVRSHRSLLAMARKRGDMCTAVRRELRLQEGCSASTSFRAPNEAEAWCAFLSRCGIVDMVVSDDYDSLVFGADLVVMRMNKDATLVHLPTILNGLGFSRDQFIDFCILCGCDFASTIRGVGKVTAFHLIKSHGTIEAALQHLPKKSQGQSPKGYRLARSLFCHFEFHLYKPRFIGMYGLPG